MVQRYRIDPASAIMTSEQMNHSTLVQGRNKMKRKLASSRKRRGLRSPYWILFDAATGIFAKRYRPRTRK